MVEINLTVEEFKKNLANGHVYRSLYHFTDRANLDSIAKHGVLSKAKLAEIGLSVPAPGGKGNNGR